MGPEEAQSMGLWDDLGQREGLYPIHSSASQSQCSVCPLPAARQGLFPLPLYCFEPQRWAWLHKSGGNATLPLVRVPVPAAKCPPFMFLCRQLSGGPQSGLVLMLLCLSVCRKDDKDYALKQIEGTGISMSACREIAVRTAWLTLFLFVWSRLNILMPFLGGLCNVQITFTL